MNVIQLEVTEKDGSKIAVPHSKDAAKQRIMTVPYDPRFPTQNQTKNCYQNYLDFFRCQKVKGEDYEPCSWYKFAYKELCPPGWVEKWNDQRARGVFPGRI